MGRTVVLNNGHGGMIGGLYQTAGKRSPKWAKGVLYEGMFNRWVVNRIIEKLDRASIPYYHVCPELKDVSLGARVRRLNEIYDKNSNTYGLEIHANGGGGFGLEGFTTVGKTKADRIGELFLAYLEEDLAHHTKLRKDTRDGDRDKEKNYFTLRKPKMPTFLLECGFMDLKKDYLNLWDTEYLNDLVDSLTKTIIQIYNED